MIRGNALGGPPCESGRRADKKSEFSGNLKLKEIRESLGIV